jgi:hypothetical protein
MMDQMGIFLILDHSIRVELSMQLPVEVQELGEGVISIHYLE